MAGKGSKQRRQERRAQLQWEKREDCIERPDSEGTDSLASSCAAEDSERDSLDQESWVRHPFKPEFAIVVRNTFLDVDEPKEVVRRRLRSEPCVVSDWSRLLLEA